jgi:hypothetical protein
MIAAMGQLLGDQKLDERIKEIKGIIERMDFRWDQGFVTDKDEFLEQRIRLQQQLEQLTPIPDDELQTAADILQNFERYWNETNGNRKAQAQLIQLVVARVWVQRNQVAAVSLRPNFHITVGLQSEKPTMLEMSFSDRNIVRNRGRRDSNPRSLP